MKPLALTCQRLDQILLTVVGMVLGASCCLVCALLQSIDTVSRLRYILSSCQRVCDVVKPFGGCRIFIQHSYDRYWMGRSTWGDVIRNWYVRNGSVRLEQIFMLINSRTLARLVWFHIPLRLQASKEGVTKEDAERVLEEKKVFIDLIEGLDRLIWLRFALTHPSVSHLL